MSVENLDQATLIQAAIASPQQLADLDKPQGDSWKLFHDLWKSWAKAPNYEQKKQIFKDRGFKVVGLFADLNELSEFLEQSHLDDQFVAQQKNLLTIDVDNRPMYRDEPHIIFVLEYALNHDPLAAKTVDYDSVRSDLKMRHDLAKVFNHKDHETIVDTFMKNYKKIKLKGVLYAWQIQSKFNANPKLNTSRDYCMTYRYLVRHGKCPMLLSLFKNPYRRTLINVIYVKGDKSNHQS